MNIAIDIRALGHGTVSGVTVYIQELLKHLFILDKENTYILYGNSFRDVKKNIPLFEAPNVRFCFTRIPNKFLNIFLRFFNFPKLDRIILKKYPDLQKIDLFFIPDPRISPISSSVKKIMTFHDLSFERFPSHFTLKTRLWHRLLNPRKEALSSDKIIAVSRFTQNELHSYYGIPLDHISVIYHGLSHDFGLHVSEADILAVKKKYHLPEKYILSLSTLERRKNLQNLIKAFECFCRENLEPYHLVIAGIAHSKIFRNVDLGSHSKVHCIGFVDEAQKAALLKGSSAFVNLSLYEGFGIPVLEALRCKVPILASDIAVFRELLGYNTFFVDPYDIFSIANGMKRIVHLSDKDDYRERLFILSQNFSWEKCAKEVLFTFFGVVFDKNPDNRGDGYSENDAKNA